MWLTRIPKYEFSYSRWIQTKEYRKEHRAQNFILNQKIAKKNNTTLQNLKISMNANKNRLTLFGVFIAVFSLGFLYDLYLPHSPKLKKLHRRAKEMILGTKNIYNKSIASVDREMVYFASELEEQIGKYYRIIDSKYPKGIQFISSRLCSTIGVEEPKNFNIKTFFTYIRKSGVPLQQILNNMRLFAMMNQMMPSS